MVEELIEHCKMTNARSERAMRLLSEFFCVLVILITDALSA